MCGCLGNKPVVGKETPKEYICLYTLDELKALLPKAEQLGSIPLSVLNNQIHIYDSNCGVLAEWIKTHIEDV